MLELGLDAGLAREPAQRLRAITLVCQDWGGLLGLRLVGDEPHRFARVVAANTFLPTGDVKPPDAFFAWRQFSQTVPEFPTSRIVGGGVARGLAPAVAAAYDAPFPDEAFKAGARQFPALVPATPDDPASEANRAAWRGLEAFPRPFVTAFGDSDPITRGGEEEARGEGAGHGRLQEKVGTLVHTAASQRADPLSTVRAIAMARR